MENFEEYNRAYKKARKQYLSDKLHKRNANLLVLDDLVNINECNAINLGVVDVPSGLIVGTKSRLRATSFSSDFMPLIKKDSEFSFKWLQVCGYHLSDTGLTDPPKVYEYMGKFYVEEGNKRVSVLKYFGAVLIPCNVIRLVEVKRNDYEASLYNEFLNYYNHSKLYSIQFKKKGYYQKLVKLMGFDEDYNWERRDRYELIGIYERFVEIIKKEKLDVYYPDAFMVMLEIYGYKHLISLTNKEIHKAIIESKRQLIFNKAHYKILCVSDDEDQGIWNGYNKKDLEDIDLIISCGDLKASYLEYLTTVTNRDLLYVHGNHDDDYDVNPPEGCVCIDDDVYEFRGLRVLGLGGSYKYRDSKYMYSEKEMELRIKKLRRKINKLGGIDIVVAHAPIKGYGDLEDYAHQGFECFKDLIHKYHPRYFLFGHVHKNYSHDYKGYYELDETQIINVSNKERIVF